VEVYQGKGEEAWYGRRIRSFVDWVTWDIVDIADIVDAVRHSISTTPNAIQIRSTESGY